jgi:hypothetical protein
MFDKKLRHAIGEIAQAHGVEPEVLMAVVKVESNARTGVRINGRMEPLIRFEGHYFYRLLPQRKRNLAVTRGLASAVAGVIRNPKTQIGRWRLLHKAEAIDRDAALRSVSWGVGQVMGDHWRWLGYASIDALVAEARAGTEGQIRLMMRFVEKAELLDKLRKHDWTGFARAYNGPGFAKHGYDRKMQDAYLEYKKSSGSANSRYPVPANRMAHLRYGSSGNDVRDLQRYLSAIGYAMHSDGDFGKITEDALRSFQVANGLDNNGVAGPEVMEAIHRRLPPIPL